MVVSGSILLINFSCSEEAKESSKEDKIIAVKAIPDLSDAIQNTVEKKPEEAVV